MVVPAQRHVLLFWDGHEWALHTPPDLRDQGYLFPSYASAENYLWRKGLYGKGYKSAPIHLPEKPKS